MSPKVSGSSAEDWNPRETRKLDNYAVKRLQTLKKKGVGEEGKARKREERENPGGHRKNNGSYYGSRGFQQMREKTAETRDSCS